MCAKIRQNLNNIFGVLFLFLASIAFLYTLRFTLGSDIWYDEVFSLSFAKRSFSDIAALTARDVHPPFYYFYLKVITSAATALFGDGAFCISAKIASCLPWCGLLALALTCIRKRFGMLTAGLFMFLVSVMPQLPVYYVEIRMYSLALLLITAHLLVADRILSGEENRRVLFILFFILGIMTAYTQYYACIATIGVYLATGLLGLLRKGDERKQILTGVLISAAVSVISYLPWLSVMLRQMENISGKYWIQPLTLRSILGSVKFVTLPVVYAGKLPEISVGLLIASVVIASVAAFVKAAKAGDNAVIQLFVLLLMPVVVVVVSGFVLSALGTPIFTYRYLIPTMGGAWLFVSIAAGKTLESGSEKKVKMLFYLLLVPFIFTGALNYKGFSDEEAKKLYEETDARIRVDSIPTGSVIITNFDHVTAVMGYYRPDCEVYLYEAEIDKILPDMLESIRDDARDETVLSLLDSGRSVYFYGSFNSREEIVAAWQEQGVNSALLDSILIERYWINVYELHK